MTLIITIYLIHSAGLPWWCYPTITIIAFCEWHFVFGEWLIQTRIDRAIRLVDSNTNYAKEEIQRELGRIFEFTRYNLNHIDHTTRNDSAMSASSLQRISEAQLEAKTMLTSIMFSSAGAEHNLAAVRKSQELLDRRITRLEEEMKRIQS